VTDFLNSYVMEGRDWRAFELCVSRLIAHCGWTDVQIVGESGDKGADILAVRYNSNIKCTESYLVQVKAVSGDRYVSIDAIDQALQGQAHYAAKIVVVATNGTFTNSAIRKQEALSKQGFNLKLWNGAFLKKLLDKWPEYSHQKRELRGYQSTASNKVISLYKSGRSRSLIILATGLGKTVVAASAADQMFDLGLNKILVLYHAIDLSTQLQMAFWREVKKTIPTRSFSSGETPIPIEGINFGLYQTFFNDLGGIEKDAFDLIIVDEAHHAMANAFASCINHLTPKMLIGLTATPWRGDGGSISTIFGEPIIKLSLIDGMKMGYLAKVDYRLMCDNIDWENIPELARKKVSIKDLNKRLFIPQRDEAVISALQEVMADFDNPRIAVFSPSIKHAEAFAAKLVTTGIRAANLSVDDKIERRKLLLSFATGKLQAITAVDVLNEGIDVPDVNILVFLRPTHSRRIFVQQLGRGLRIVNGKTKVIILDFVTDVRRLSTILQFDKEAKSKPEGEYIETVHLDDGVVTFSDEKAGTFIDSWLGDVAGLEDEEDSATLVFPRIGDNS